jgi:hypothetical protein
MAFRAEPPATAVLVGWVCEASLKGVQSETRSTVGIDETVCAEHHPEHPFV